MNCHAQDGRAGARNGLVLDTALGADAAHSALIDSGTLLPGDATCSEVVRRISGIGPVSPMPEGSAGLSEGEQCAIGLWVARGALKN